MIKRRYLIIYININPSDSRKALLEFNKTMADMCYIMTTSGDKELMGKNLNKVETILHNCYQKNRGSRTWIDIDCDILKDCKIYESGIKETLKEREIEHYWIDTKGGYHLLLKVDTLSKWRTNPNELVEDLKVEFLEWLSDNTDYKEITTINTKEKSGVIADEDFFEIKLNKNAMIPLPGTIQAGYPVTIINKEN